MTEGKTSTFTIHHDRCKPENWTARDIIAFRDFVRTGSMQNAAALSRLGVQLVLSEHHEPKGGELEPIGWMEPEGSNEVHELEDLTEDDITSLCAVYRGPVQHIAKIGIGDEDGNHEGFEYEIKPTLEEAQAYIAAAYDNNPVDPDNVHKHTSA